MKNFTNDYIDVKEVSKNTGIPATRIINKILMGDLNGVVIDAQNAVVQKSELPYIK